MTRPPATDAEIALLKALIGNGLSSRGVAAEMGKTRKWVLCAAERFAIKWRSQHGSSRAMMQRPVPADFATLAPTIIAAKLMTHYGCSWVTLMRWFRETGVERHREPPGPAKAIKLVKAPVLKPVQTLGRMGAKPAPAIVEHFQRDMTVAGQAADFLRRLGPVSRCNDAGRPDADGCYWRRGSAVLTDRELVERAECKGWRAVGLAA